MAKVKVDDHLKELLGKLEEIGKIKNNLPFNGRGWCNILGLYVQLNSKGGVSRLQAGEKYRSKIDAWLDDSSDAEWKVKKYNSGKWEKLVNPTFDIASWLIKHGGLPEVYMDSFNKAVEVFNKKGYLKLPEDKLSTYKSPEDVLEIRSCELCQYGPKVCIRGFGKPRVPEEAAIIIDPFFEQHPIFNYLRTPNKMPCFEHKIDLKTSS